MSYSIDAMALLVVICTVLLVLTAGVFALTFLLWESFKYAVVKYIKAKEKVWVVRRWAEAEKEIVNLKNEISVLKKSQGVKNV